MLAALLLLTQIAAARPDTAGARRAADTLAVGDSTYATATVQAVVDAAARLNRVVPAGLGGYQAHLESEISLVARQADGVEGVATLEQVASRVAWQRTGAYEQHVVGYRAQQSGPALSALTFVHQAWTVPVLYGNRLSLLVGAPDTAGRSRAQRRERTREQRRNLLVVHPLAEDRVRYYRFSGGDTVTVVRVQGRRIPIVRVHVRAAPRVAVRAVLFQGDMDLDASRGHLVRMRGDFVRVGPSDPVGIGTRLRRLARLTFTGVAYVELVNAEIAGAYWLPSYQRVELQASFAAAGDDRSIFRMVSRSDDYRITADTAVPAALAGADSAADTLRLLPHRLTYAHADSLARFDRWDRPLGALSAGLRAEDFDDVAPDLWRATGPPRFEPGPLRLADLVHIDRVEGLYTGYGARERFRDAAPGLELRANAGYAWSEHTVRGRGGAYWSRERWAGEAVAGRVLDVTNAFLTSFDSGSTYGALFNSEDYDYVDRRIALVSVARRIGGRRTFLARLEEAAVQDADAARHREWGPIRIGTDSALRLVRGVDPGRYARSRLTLAYHPEVNAEFVEPGVGAQLWYERGDGELNYQRVTGRLQLRRNWMPWIAVARLDGGLLLGAHPPAQELFTMGGTGALAGYEYAEFGGDRAALARLLGMYQLRLLQAPIRIGRWILPGLAPALSLGLDGGWAEASSDGARAALRRQALCVAVAADPCGATLLRPSVPTDRIRATINGGLRFFGGSVLVGVARPLDQARGWRFELGLGQVL